MKRLTILLILVLFNVYMTHAQDDLFNINPAGGEAFVNGDTTLISWANSSTYTQFDISLWDGTSCSWTTIAQNVDTTFYSWPIDVSNFGDRFRIKVQLSDSSNDYAFSTSYFSILMPPQQFTEVNDKAKEESPELSIFPNPANTTLGLVLQYHIIKSVYFWNSSGRIVYNVDNINSSQCKLSLAGLSAGEYFVDCLSGENKRYIKKVIIKR